MDAIEMIKCHLAKDSNHNGDVRYVPLEIYEMWRFLMQRVHKLVVRDPHVSVWVPTDPYAGGDGPEATETVIEIHFKYLDNKNVRRPVTRYFPEENFEQIYAYFRKHFPEESKMEGVTRRKGYYFNDRAVPYKPVK